MGTPRATPSTRGRLRNEVFMSGITKAMHSRLAHFFFSLTLAALFVLTINAHWPKVLLLVPIILAIVSHNVMLFEIFMCMNMIKNMFGYWNWFNLVDDNLYLGAVLMLPSDPTIVSKKLGVAAILCTLEAHEMAYNSLFGSTVPPEIWRRLEIDFSHLPIRDFSIPTFEQLNKGANYLNLHLAENRRVYLYCRSGCGRSACVAMAYFVRHRGMTAKDAYDKLAKKRRINFRWGSAQANNLIAYEQSFRGGRGSM